LGVGRRSRRLRRSPPSVCGVRSGAWQSECREGRCRVSAEFAVTVGVGVSVGGGVSVAVQSRSGVAVQNRRGRVTVPSGVNRRRGGERGVACAVRRVTVGVAVRIGVPSRCRRVTSCGGARPCGVTVAVAVTVRRAVESRGVRCVGVTSVGRDGWPVAVTVASRSRVGVLVIVGVGVVWPSRRRQRWRRSGGSRRGRVGVIARGRRVGGRPAAAVGIGTIQKPVPSLSKPAAARQVSLPATLTGSVVGGVGLSGWRKMAAERSRPPGGVELVPDSHRWWQSKQILVEIRRPSYSTPVALAQAGAVALRQGRRTCGRLPTVGNDAANRRKSGAASDWFRSAGNLELFARITVSESIVVAGAGRWRLTISSFSAA